MSKIDELRLGFETAYINGSAASNSLYRPQFVSNNHKEGKKVLSSVEDELLKCDRFQISVAFITMSGITPLLQTLKELENKNIPGEILTTNYLNFSEPGALKKLNDLSNITLKMYDVEAADEGFHTKGYIFRKDEIYRIIIGSSNITSAALTSNREWNTKLVSTSQGEVAEDILKEFDELWNSEYALDYDVFYEEFKGTGNMELVLDRKLQEKRVFPAIDIQKSGTRREDLLLTPDEQEAVYNMRRALNSLKAEDAVEQILNMFSRTKNNEEFVQTAKKQKFL